MVLYTYEIVAFIIIFIMIKTALLETKS